MFGYMLVPTARSLRLASFLNLELKVCSMSCWIKPCSRLFKKPPCDSIFCSSAQILTASSCVNLSMYQEPPAGSTGSSKLNSFCSMICAFLATRLENSLSGRNASSKQQTVKPSTPPITAENASVVLRSIFTYGSNIVLVNDEVRAKISQRWAASSPPKLSAMRAQIIRAARILAISIKKFAPCEKSNLSRLAASPNITPRLNIARNVSIAAVIAYAASWTALAPPLWATEPRIKIVLTGVCFASAHLIVSAMSSQSASKSFGKSPVSASTPNGSAPMQPVKYLASFSKLFKVLRADAPA